MIPEISVEDLKQKKDAGAITIIDVRTPAEYRSVHIPGAISYPLDVLNVGEILARYQSAPFYVVCHGGNRSAKAVEQLQSGGCTQATSVRGGTKAWQDAGYPVNRDRGVISLDRQVRIAAGSFVLLGVILGSMVAPVFYWLSAFVGAGLVFAGVTDTCGLAMVLARMPWNQSSAGTCCATKCS